MCGLILCRVRGSRTGKNYCEGDLIQRWWRWRWGEWSHSKVELADVKWEVRESEGLVMIIRFCHESKESMGL